MINKIQNIFEKETLNTNGKILTNDQFELLKNKLINRKIIIEHDLILFKKFIIDFPFNFDEFCSYIKQIYKFEIEKQINSEFIQLEEIEEKIFKFLNFYSIDKLDNISLSNVLKNLNLSLEHTSEILTKLKQVNFLFKSVRDDYNKFLWEKIYQNIKNQNEVKNPDFFIENSQVYQNLNKQKIEYESNIIKVTRIHYNIDRSVKIKKFKQILIEKAYCTERRMPIESWKIPNEFYDKDTLEKFYNKCKASNELVLSKHFQKFLGYDEINDDEHQIYFFEYLTGNNLKNYILNKELDTNEFSLIFKYLAKEILLSFKDLLNKCTHTFSFPINLSNIFYDTQHLRVYLHFIDFGPPRKNVLESDQIIQAKLLYYYALILIDILALKNPQLLNLSQKIGMICNDFQEFYSMQKIFDYIFDIEGILTKELENDILIAIIIECLISPYKSKIVFDEFYNKKNFIKEIFKSKKKDIDNHDNDNDKNKKKPLNDNLNIDETIAYGKYYEDEKENGNSQFKNLEENQNKILSINYLLIHPFYEEANYDTKFISYMMKVENENENEKDNQKIN